MIGRRFGSLVVVSEAGRTKWQTVLWLCSCDCGRQKAILGSSLRSGNSRSCGCGAIATRFGVRNDNPNWKGDAVTAKVGRDRARRWHQTTRPCAVVGCESKPERHHKDGDTKNNDVSNIEWLCHRHHMQLELTGKPKPQVVRERIAATLRGRHLSASHREALSASGRAAWVKRRGGACA